jgi:hypothetical protein
MLATGVSISRNMVVVWERDELTLIGSVRMSPENEKSLEELGKVTHLVRISGHTIDDAYTMHRFKLAFWCLYGAEDRPNVA